MVFGAIKRIYRIYIYIVNGIPCCQPNETTSILIAETMTRTMPDRADNVERYNFFNGINRINLNCRVGRINHICCKRFTLREIYSHFWLLNIMYTDAHKHYRLNWHIFVCFWSNTVYNAIEWPFACCELFSFFFSSIYSITKYIRNFERNTKLTQIIKIAGLRPLNKCIKDRIKYEICMSFATCCVFCWTVYF